MNIKYFDILKAPEANIDQIFVKFLGIVGTSNVPLKQALDWICTFPFSLAGRFREP